MPLYTLIFISLKGQYVRYWIAWSYWNLMIKKLALKLIKIYQETISQVTPASCRFSPTCSQYTFEAINKYGVFKGIYLGIVRLIKCNPFNKGGYDPVP